MCQGVCAAAGVLLALCGKGLGEPGRGDCETQGKRHSSVAVESMGGGGRGGG